MGVYDKRFAPMAASGNATRVFSGTAWTGDTLLDREKRLALELEERDGLRRLFIVDGEQVARSNRLYGKFLTLRDFQARTPASPHPYPVLL